MSPKFSPPCGLRELLSQIHPRLSQHVASPLHHLTKKVEPWQWTEPEETAFRALKLLVTSAPIINSQTRVNASRLETDASGYVTRAILSQLRDDNMWPQGQLHV